jgi:hypothetical protein
MIIYDDFITDLDLLDRISEDESFWQPGYRWWDGWWNAETEDLRHELITEIWGQSSPHRGISCSGFEHWVGDYKGEDEPHYIFNEPWSLKPHFDKDEDHWHETKEVIGPKIGTVFYPCREVDEMEGGLLHYWGDYGADMMTEDNMLIYPPNPPEIIKAKFNRLIIFDASKLHAVSKVTYGRRRAIAINLWDKKPLEFERKDY